MTLTPDSFVIIGGAYQPKKVNDKKGITIIIPIIKSGQYDQIKQFLPKRGVILGDGILLHS